MQLWNRGLLSSSTQWQNEICSGLVDTCGVDFDLDAYGGYFDHQRVTIQPFELDINEQQLEYLRDNYNPLQRSGDNGVDIYINVRTYIANL